MWCIFVVCNYTQVICCITERILCSLLKDRISVWRFRLFSHERKCTKAEKPAMQMYWLSNALLSGTAHIIASSDLLWCFVIGRYFGCRFRSLHAIQTGRSKLELLFMWIFLTKLHSRGLLSPFPDTVSFQTSFPPNIYYKIFTHRPVVDLCASSPKDYTHAGQKRAVAQQVHNGLPLVQDDRSGWYRRVENNGWRLLSGKVDQSSDNMLLVTYVRSKIMNVPEGIVN